MEDYYEQFDDSIDNTLQELTNYVSHVLSMKQNNFDVYLYGYEYTDVILSDRLSKYSNEIVIPRLESLSHALQTITRKDIEKAIPDVEQWDSNDIMSMENVRQQLFEGIKNTVLFISNIVTTKQEMHNIKLPKLLSYKGEERRLNQFKRELKPYYDNTTSFNDIFKGQAPNERINWIMAKYEFHYFMRILFQKLFNRKTIDWVIVGNSFTLNGEKITPEFKGNNDYRRITSEFKTKINTAFDILLN